MSKVSIQGNSLGTGTLTIAAPNTNTDRTLTLPDETGTVVSTASTPTFTGAVTAPAFIPNGSTVPTNGTFLPASNTLAWSTGSTERMRIDSSGNVGIGTTSPASGRRLTIGNTGADSAIRINAPTGYSSYIELTENSSSSANEYWQINKTPTTHALQFWNGSERARIDSSGNLLVGTTTTTAKFNITNGSEQQISQYINNTNASPVGVQIRYATDVNAATNRFIDCIGNATSRFIVYSNGNAVNTNGSYGTISDVKLKQDIVDAGSQWNDIKNLRFRKYRLKSDVELNPNAKPLLGLVAQEAELVSPNLIEEQHDTDGEGNDLGTTTKSIKTSILYMKAVKALQEAMERIETLEAQNAAFEARLAALEAK